MFVSFSACSNYYTRYDYEGIETAAANALMAELTSMVSSADVPATFAAQAGQGTGIVVSKKLRRDFFVLVF